ncbi:hypothetical protein ON010_g16944 [Phytophthora cinnamomi]|nr:hypothetical protein ON010_g16944 [Phytophthora cinnamomi]
MLKCSSTALQSHLVEVEAFHSDPAVPKLQWASRASCASTATSRSRTRRRRDSDTTAAATTRPTSSSGTTASQQSRPLNPCCPTPTDQERHAAASASASGHSAAAQDLPSWTPVNPTSTTPATNNPLLLQHLPPSMHPAPPGAFYYCRSDWG